MKIKRICRYCGKNIKFYPSAIKRGQGKFCNLKCMGKWQSEHQTGKNNPNWKGGKVKIICQQCGKEREVYPYEIKKRRDKFCSPKCYNESQKTQIKCICQQCGIEFPITPSQIKHGRGKFCSPECQHKYHSGKNHPAWQGGISFEPYCQKFNNEFKEYIRNKFGRVCFLCPITEEENGQKLSVHHVNYNKNCGCDDDKTCQFVPLCRGCNTKVNNNREMWEAKINAIMQNKLNGWYI